MFKASIPRDHKALLVSHIQSYFESELNDSIGNLAAENLLDFVVKHAGPIIYNQAVSDARVLVLQQMERLEEELYTLQTPIQLSQRG